MPVPAWRCSNLHMLIGKLTIATFKGVQPLNPTYAKPSHPLPEVLRVDWLHYNMAALLPHLLQQPAICDCATFKTMPSPVQNVASKHLTLLAQNCSSLDNNMDHTLCPLSSHNAARLQAWRLPRIVHTNCCMLLLDSIHRSQEPFQACQQPCLGLLT
jgi:hypothetical protein